MTFFRVCMLHSQEKIIGYVKLGFNIYFSKDISAENIAKWQYNFDYWWNVIFCLNVFELGLAHSFYKLNNWNIIQKGNKGGKHKLDSTIKVVFIFNEN